MTYFKQYFLLLYFSLFLFNCSNKRPVDYKYNLKYYKRLVIGKNENYEFFINQFDTSRTVIKKYWDNGHLQQAAFFLNRKKDGRWIQYFPDNKISAIENYLNGKKDGYQKLYYFNGKIFSIEEYSLDKGIGNWTYFDSLGNIIRIEKH